MNPKLSATEGYSLIPVTNLGVALASETKDAAPTSTSYFANLRNSAAKIGTFFLSGFGFGKTPSHDIETPTSPATESEGSSSSLKNNVRITWRPGSLMKRLYDGVAQMMRGSVSDDKATVTNETPIAFKTTACSDARTITEGSISIPKEGHWQIISNHALDSANENLHEPYEPNKGLESLGLDTDRKFVHRISTDDATPISANSTAEARLAQAKATVKQFASQMHPNDPIKAEVLEQDLLEVVNQNLFAPAQIMALLNPEKIPDGVPVITGVGGNDNPTQFTYSFDASSNKITILAERTITPQHCTFPYKTSSESQLINVKEHMNHKVSATLSVELAVSVGDDGHISRAATQEDIPEDMQNRDRDNQDSGSPAVERRVSLLEYKSVKGSWKFD